MKISLLKTIMSVSLLFVLFFNFTFYKNVINVYDFENIICLFSIIVVLFALMVLIITIFSSKYILKFFLIVLFVVSALTAYFMDMYGVVVDDGMIRNIFQTNFSEVHDLISFRLFLYFLLLGVVPSFLIYRTKIIYKTFKEDLILRIKIILLSLGIIIFVIFSFSKFYASFFREHKVLRYNVNPIYWMYSIGKYTSKTFTTGPLILKKIGRDAEIIKKENEKKELVIMVVGETARADNFSLNGYERETNPLLKKENIFNFSNMSSCGTSTAISVPCMFSIYDSDDYSYKKGISTENVLDVLKNTKKINILWRDNNSDSKGVALRVKYEDYRTSKTNTICDNDECRDEGMLVGLDEYIKKSKEKNILIILHQMGNHGPAYYKRYPKEFEKFTPVCRTNQLEKCTKEEVRNAYDNAILYTDYFLSKVIDLLKPYSREYNTAMLYMSDHGESLGEKGLYLHGMPYFIAPKEQTQIPSILWLGGEEVKNKYDINKIKDMENKNFSHDYLFSTLLGLFKVKSKIYNKNKDILYESEIK